MALYNEQFRICISGPDRKKKQKWSANGINLGKAGCPALRAKSNFEIIGHLAIINSIHASHAQVMTAFLALCEDEGRDVSETTSPQPRLVL